MPTTISTCDSASRACKNSGLACGKLARLKWRLNVVEVIEVLRWSPRRTPAGQYRRLVWDTPFSRNSQDQMTMCQKRVLSDRRLPEVGVVQRGQRMLDWVQLVTFERAPSLVSEHGAIWGKLSSKVRGGWFQTAGDAKEKCHACLRPRCVCMEEYPPKQGSS
jgi:hypothetical protein